MADSTTTPRKKRMPMIWGLIALAVIAVVLVLAWLFGMFDGEPTGTVLGETPRAVQIAPAGFT